jgi:single-strand DNA-binding protein
MNGLNIHRSSFIIYRSRNFLLVIRCFLKLKPYFYKKILFIIYNSIKMSYESVGKLYKKFATESKSEKFQVREFVIEIADGQYPQLIKFQLAQERCQLLDGYEEGEEIKVHFDLRGREWQGKFFSTLNCWRLEKSDGSPSAKPVAQAQNSSPKPTPPANTDDSFPTLSDAPFKTTAGDDDLPF